jgi:hypothetical protein
MRLYLRPRMAGPTAAGGKQESPTSSRSQIPQCLRRSVARFFDSTLILRSEGCLVRRQPPFAKPPPPGCLRWRISRTQIFCMCFACNNRSCIRFILSSVYRINKLPVSNAGQGSTPAASTNPYFQLLSSYRPIKIHVFPALGKIFGGGFFLRGEITATQHASEPEFFCMCFVCTN